jgi:hypothetical protein
MSFPAPLGAQHMSKVWHGPLPSRAGLGAWNAGSGKTSQRAGSLPFPKQLKMCALISNNVPSLTCFVRHS